MLRIHWQLGFSFCLVCGFCMAACIAAVCCLYACIYGALYGTLCGFGIAAAWLSLYGWWYGCR